MALNSTKATVNIALFKDALINLFRAKKIETVDWNKYKDGEKQFICSILARPEFKDLIYSQVLRQFKSYMSAANMKLHHGKLLFDLTKKFSEDDNTFAEVNSFGIMHNVLQLFENHGTPCLPKMLRVFLERYRKSYIEINSGKCIDEGDLITIGEAEYALRETVIDFIKEATVIYSDLWAIVTGIEITAENRVYCGNILLEIADIEFEMMNRRRDMAMDLESPLAKLQCL